MNKAVKGKTTTDDCRKQNSAAESAQKAVELIFRYYRIDSSFSIDKAEELDEKLEAALLPSGVIRRAVRLQKGWRRDASGAMLVKRRDNGHYTALIPGNFSGYTFFDETDCRRKTVSKKNEGIFESEAYAFYLPFPAEKITMPRLLKFSLQSLTFSDIFWLLLTALAVSAIGLVTPFLSRYLLSDVVSSASLSLLLCTAAFLVCSLISAQLFNIAKSLADARIVTKIKLSAEAATMMRVLSLPPHFFKDYAAGDLANRCEGMNQICELMIHSVLTTGLSGVFSVIYVVQIAVLTPSLAIPAMILLCLSALITFITVYLQMKITSKRMQAQASESAMSYAMVMGMRKLKLAGAEQRALSRWENKYQTVAELSYNPPLFLKISTVLTTAVSVLGTIVFFVIAAKSGVSTADYFAFSTAFGMVSGAFAAISQLSLTATRIKPALDMCRPILFTLPENNQEKLTVSSISGAVSVRNLSFRYNESGRDILSDISLDIKEGEYVAIVGATGCGKSTLLRLLLGFEQPTDGDIYYDGNSIGSLNTASLRKRIGTVLQNSRLMQSDIYSNIALTAPYLSRKAVWHAAELAQIADDIRAMPMGMSTMISEGLGGLSGGQRQRLMIARAIAPSPNLLLFDEATSALDNITQKKVSDALSSLHCTRIVVAHRLSTVRSCDRIIVLDQGKIVEDGTYNELMDKKGYFAQLVERQRTE